MRAVDLRADAAVADVGVDLVGEVERRRARRQRLDLALGREDEDLVLEQVDLQGVHELLGVRQLLLPVQQASAASAACRRRRPRLSVL